MYGMEAVYAFRVWIAIRKTGFLWKLDMLIGCNTKVTHNVICHFMSSKTDYEHLICRLPFFEL